MGSTRITAALVIAVIGLALVIVEAVQTLRSETLGTLGTIALYVGLGLFVIGAAILVADQADQHDEPSAAQPPPPRDPPTAVAVD